MKNLTRSNGLVLCCLFVVGMLVAYPVTAEAGASCFGVNKLKIAAKDNKVEIKGTFSPSAPFDPNIDDVNCIIEDDFGAAVGLPIPAGSFQIDGGPEKLKFKYQSAKGSEPDIKAKFDFLKCEFEIKAKKVPGADAIAEPNVLVVLIVGANFGQELLQVEAKDKQLEHKKHPHLDCCPPPPIEQCIASGESFEPIDLVATLDPHGFGIPPYMWTVTGNVNLSYTIDVNDVMHVTYPSGWSGTEVLTVTFTDAMGQVSPRVDFSLTVCVVPLLFDIPDQNCVFQSFDLDDYLDPNSPVGPNDMEWSYSAPKKWKVKIDADNVVTVTPPKKGTAPGTITFTATSLVCPCDEPSASDDAIFDPWCGPLVGCGPCKGKVTELRLRNNGADANVAVYEGKKPKPSKSGKKPKKDTKVFEGNVLNGGEFAFDGVGVGKDDTLGTEISIYVDGDFHTKIHTSCSKPIGPGLVSGDFEVVSGESKDGGPLCSISPLVSNFCDDHKKPKVLTMSYTALDCSMSSHAQGKKASCEDFAALPTSVYIVAQEDKKKGRVWFAGTVGIGQFFDIDAANAGKKKLEGSSVLVNIYSDVNDTLLQQVKIHTSCSQPLRYGDRFGSLLLVGFVPADK